MRTQQYMFKFKTCEEDPSLMNAFKKRNIKLLIDPVEQCISYFEKDGSGDKSQCPTNSLLLEKRNHLNHQTAYIDQCISRSTESDSLVQSITNYYLENNIRRELNRSICSPTFQQWPSSTSFSIFQKAVYRPRTAIC